MGKMEKPTSSLADNSLIILNIERAFYDFHFYGYRKSYSNLKKNESLDTSSNTCSICQYEVYIELRNTVSGAVAKKTLGRFSRPAMSLFEDFFKHGFIQTKNNVRALYLKCK